ncbi:unnamed protein product, partial [Amoebophrya sp. A120]|eukprot:GSA120T00019455001.1
MAAREEVPDTSLSGDGGGDGEREQEGERGEDQEMPPAEGDQQELHAGIAPQQDGPNRSWIDNTCLLDASDDEDEESAACGPGGEENGKDAKNPDLGRTVVKQEDKNSDDKTIGNVENAEKNNASSSCPHLISSTTVEQEDAPPQLYLPQVTDFLENRASGDGSCPSRGEIVLNQGRGGATANGSNSLYYSTNAQQTSFLQTPALGVVEPMSPPDDAMNGLGGGTSSKNLKENYELSTPNGSPNSSISSFSGKNKVQHDERGHRQQKFNAASSAGNKQGGGEDKNDHSGRSSSSSSGSDEESSSRSSSSGSRRSRGSSSSSSSVSKGKKEKKRRRKSKSSASSKSSSSSRSSSSQKSPSKDPRAKKSATICSKRDKKRDRKEKERKNNNKASTTHGTASGRNRHNKRNKKEKK